MNLIPGLIAFTARNWKQVIIAMLLLGIVLANVRAEHWKQRAAQERTAHAETVASYRAAADKAKALDLANAIRIERKQAEIAHNVALDTENRLADLRIRLDRLRTEAKAHTSGAGSTDMPSGATATGHSACPAESLDILAEAEANTIRLIGWQKWWAKITSEKPTK